MRDYGTRAAELFEQGYNCAQAVFGAFAEDLGMERETALRVACSFGGGMGRMREVCGACSGMFLVAGMVNGTTDGADREGKKENYDTVQRLAGRFREENGSIICRELLAGVSVENAGTTTPEERTGEYYKKRPCKELVRLAAKIAAEELIGEGME